MTFTRREQTIMWTGGVLCLLFLAPCMLFPISSDLALFALGGRVLLDGGAMYADFVDIKPPLVFYVLAVVQYLFGEGELNIRIFDYFWQIGTAVSIVAVLRQQKFTVLQAVAGACLYTLAYTAQNYPSTMQCESLSALPLLWAVHWFVSKRESGLHRMLVGFLVGFAFCLKFTLGIVFVPLLLSDIFIDKVGFGALLKRWLGIGAGFLIAVALLFVLPLMKGAALEGYGLMAQFTVGYVEIQQWTLDYIRTALKLIPHYFGEKFSMALLLGLGAVLLQYFRRVRSGADADDRWTPTAFLVALFLFVSVLLEKKFIPYHYGRMYVFLLPLAAIGLVAAYHFLRDVFRSGNAGAKVLVIALAGTMLVFSPVTRFVNILRPSVYYFTDRAKYDAIYERGTEDDSSVIREQQLEVVNYVDSLRAPGERTFIVATQAGILYYFLDETPVPKFPSSQFYGTPMSPEPWVREFAPRLAKVDWIIVHTNDRYIQINGTDKTGVDVINDDPAAAKILREEFRLEHEFEFFRVYKRI